MECSPQGGSQFCRDLHKVKHWFKMGAAHTVNDGGRSTRFLTDVWIDEVPLKCQFPNIFAICMDKDAKVADLLEAEGWNVECRRTFGIKEIQEWEALMLKLQDVQLT